MDFDARRALSDPGFTPGARHLPALFDLLERCAEDDTDQLIRVIARAGSEAVTQAAERFGGAAPVLRLRLVRVLARAPDDARSVAMLKSALCDPDPRVRRWAARGLGKVRAGSAELEAALLAAFEGADLPLQRALVEALGNVGSAAGAAFLGTLAVADPELGRRVQQARLKLERTAARTSPSRIALGARLPRPALVVARTRAGLARFAAEELAGFPEVRLPSNDRVELVHDGTLGELLLARTALDFGLLLRASGAGEPTPASVAALLATDAAREPMRAWTEGPLRFRLSHAAGGHRRAAVWKIAELLDASGAELVNDPQRAPWEVIVGRDLASEGLLLVPRAFDDPRFAYRRGDVPAASHPTLAAALARAAGVRGDDVVWDPFVGSGLELAERALLGPYRKLVGSDLSAAALAVARANLDAAGAARCELVRADALEYAPEGVTLILSNPPMGRRVARDGSLPHLLRTFVARAAQVLVPGGRLVWLSPLPELTATSARAAGLVIQTVTEVDLGGFSAALQIAQAPARPTGQATPVPPSPQ